MKIHVYLLTTTFLAVFLTGMDKSTNYEKLEEYRKYISPLKVAQSIEKTKEDLHNLPWTYSCFHHEGHPLEKRLAFLINRAKKLDESQEKIIVEDASTIQILNFSNKNLDSMYRLLVNKLSSLTKLYLRDNALEVLPLNDIVSTCSCLTDLNVKNNKISFISYGANAYPYSILRLDTLRTLVLKKNKLKEFDFNACFYMFPNIQELDLSKNALDTYTWETTSGWYHAYSEENKWPIIKIEGTHFDREELCAHYADMSEKYFEHHFKRDCCSTSLCAMMFSSLVGLPLGILTYAITNSYPAFASTVLAAMAVGETCTCCVLKASSIITHNKRMFSLGAAEANIIGNTNMSDKETVDIV